MFTASKSTQKSKVLSIFAVLILISKILFAQDVPFDISTLQFNGFPTPERGTSLQFGPDGRLYLADLKSEVRIYTIEKSGQNTYTVTDYEVLLDVQNIPNHDDIGIPARDGRNVRQSTGLIVVGTSANPVIYIGSSDPKWGGPSGDRGLDTNSGIITRLNWTGAEWEVIDLVRGLPRSEENHSTNGLEFKEINGIPYLLVTSGGNTNAGSPSTNFAWTNEYALASAILSVDLNAIDAFPTKTDPNSGRSFKYDIPTLDDPYRENVNGIYNPNDPNYDGIDVGDPFGGNDGLNMAMVVEGGPVQIFSGGYRNTYDLVVTEAGKVFVTDNGPNANWGGLPKNEGNPLTITNEYVVGEPGNNSTNPSPSGEYVTNKDHLMMVTGDIGNYQFAGYYGGHPTPIRANPGNPYIVGAPFPYNTGGAGLFTRSIGDDFGWGYIYPSYTENEIFRTQILEPIAPGEPGFLTYASTTLPANWPPVPPSLADPNEADYRDPDLYNPNGPQPEIVTMWPVNTNAIEEYTSSAFGGAIKGALIAGRNGGRLHLVTLNPDGSLKDLFANKWNLNGGNALGLTSNGDDEIFPGTIWVSTFDDRIHIFTPADLGFCPSPDDPLFDPDADYDNDGYTNQDEIDNGTDYCSGASVPSDFDGDFVSDLNDLDDDGDGIPDESDPFQLGKATNLPIDNELFSDNTDELGRPFGYLGLGLTGLMNNGAPNPNWLNWLDVIDEGPLPNDIYGGAAGAIQIAMTGGTANGAVNNQHKGFQFGVNVGIETGEFFIRAGLLGLDGPQMFYDIDHNGELGIQMGDGTQSNFFRFVFTKTHLVAGLEINNVPDPEPLMLPITTGDRPDPSEKVEFILRVNSILGIVEPMVQIGNRPILSLGTKALSGILLDVIRDNSLPLAIGVFGTSGQQGVEFLATYDYFKVTAEQPYIINNILDLTRQAGSGNKMLELTDYFNDNGGVENLNFSLTNSNPAILADISGSLLTLVFPSEPDSTEITVRATDANGYAAEQSFKVKVIPAEQILYRVNAGGNAISGVGDSPNWKENSSDGAYEGDGYTVNTGSPKPTVFTFENRSTSIPSYISENTFSGIFANARENAGSENMTFSIPVTDGNYSVNLFFGNGTNESSSIGQRVFDIRMEDQLVFDDLDLVQRFGHGAGGMEQFSVVVEDGVLDIEFVRQTGNPLVHAIEILGTQISDPIIIVQEIENQQSIVGEVLDGTLRIRAEGGVGTLYYNASNLPPGIDIEEVNGRIYGTVENSAIAGSPYQVTIEIEDSNYPVQNKEFFNFSWTIEQQAWNISNENQNYTERHENSFVQAGKSFYMMGGRENSTTIDKYDYETDTWNALENVAPLSFNHFQATTYKGYIWVIGAFQDNAYPNEAPATHVWLFDPVNETYIMGPEIPENRRRGSAGLVMYNDKFYVIGGNTIGHDGGYVPYFDEFDPKTGTWTALVDAPHPRDHFHAVVIGKKLYAASGRLSGGDGGTFGPVVNEVDVYDFETQSWSSLPGSLNIPTGRAGAVVANYNDQLLVAGGETPDDDNALAVTEIFDPSIQIWSNGMDLNFPRHSTQGIISGSGLFVAGGSPKRGGGRQRNMEYYGLNNPEGISLSESVLSIPDALRVNSEGSVEISLSVTGGNQGIFIDNMYIEGIDASDFTFENGGFSQSILFSNSAYPIKLLYSGSKENLDAKFIVEYGSNKRLEVPIQGNVPVVVPDAPIAISPADQASGIGKTPELTWEPEPTVDGYTLQVSQNSDFSPIIVDVSDVTGNSFTTPELQSSTTYYWRVAASNEAGTSLWSQTWSFTTLEPVIVVPSAPTAISPINEETDLPKTVELTWEPQTLADNYKIQVSTISDFSSLEVNIVEFPGTSFTTPLLQANTTYFWRVAAFNAEGDSPWSTAWIFSTAADPSSSLAELVGHWKMEEGSGSTLIDNSGKGNNANIVNNSGITWVPGKDGLALRMTGSLNRFATVPHNSSLDINNAITIAAWIRPAGLSRKQILSKGGPEGYEFSIFENGKVEFRFNRESEGNNYMIQSLTDYPTDGETWMHVAVTFNGSTSTLYINGVADNSISYSPVQILSNTTDLMIGAKEGNNRWEGDLDEIRLYNGALEDFEVFDIFGGEVVAPIAPQLGTPANGATGLAPSGLTLEWSPVDFANSYRIQFAQNLGFSNGLIELGGIEGTSYSAPDLLYNTTYYWRVAASNTAGDSPWSQVWSFSTASEVVANDLVGHWMMEEGSGNTLIDQSGTGNDATIRNTSGVSWVSGRVGLALRLNGSLNRFATVPHNSSLDIHDAITISAWIRPMGMSRRQILSKGGPEGYEFSIYENGKVEFRFNRESQGNNYMIRSLADYPTDGQTWMHVAITFDGTTSKMYINGVEDNSITYSPVQILSNTTDLMIGAKEGNNRWDGDLDEIRLYKRALSTQEVFNLYDGGTEVPDIPAATPQLNLPADNATNLPKSNLNLTWDASSSASEYQVQVAQNTDFTGTLIEASGITSTSFIVEELLENTTYFWRVAASNEVGVSPWSATWSFTTLEPNIVLPGAPAPISPNNGETDLPKTVELTWEPQTLADNYKIQVSTISDFSSLVVNIEEFPGTSFTTPLLQANTTYFWRVAAFNAEGDSPWSTAWIFSTAADPSSSLAELVGHWKMEEGSGSTLIDHSGNGNDANIVNNSGITWVPGKEGLALRMTGSLNRFAAVPHNSSLDINDAITIAAWIRPTGLSRRQILSKGGPEGYEFSIFENGKVEFRFNRESEGNNYMIRSLSDYPTDGQTWMHVAVTFDGTTSTLYINGVEDNSITYAPVQILSNTTDVMIGAKEGNNRWDGDLDEIRLYNGALVDFEIFEIANGELGATAAPQLGTPANGTTGLAPSGLILDWNPVDFANSYRIQFAQDPGFTSGLIQLGGIEGTSYAAPELLFNTTYYWRVAASNTEGESPWSQVWSFSTASEVIAGDLVGHWMMEEGSGNILIDHSGTGNDATLQSNSGVSWVTGQVGLALRLNGSLNRFATVPHNSSLDINNAITIAAWIRPTGMSRRQILSKGGPEGYEFSIYENGKVEFRFNRESEANNYMIRSLSDYPTDGNTWMHVAVTFDGTTSRIYINGVEDNSITYAPVQILSNTTDVMIGAKEGNNRWQGDLDEIRLYKRALTAGEISGIAGSGQALRILGTPDSENGNIAESNEREPVFVTRMYPNPVNDVIKLELTGVMEKDQVQVHIFDMRGVQIMEGGFEFKNGELTIDISNSNLAQGMHVLIVNHNRFQQVFKFIKK